MGESGGAAGAGGERDAGGAQVDDPKLVPPFIIPTAADSGTLVPCDSSAVPNPVGVLADGRVVVVQELVSANERVGLEKGLIRAWDPRTARLENLFTVEWRLGESDVPLRVTETGRIVELPALAGGHGFRIYDVERRTFTAPGAFPVDAVAASPDLNFVIDGDLRRFTAEGEPDLDFASLLPREATFWTPSEGLRARVALGNEAAAFLSVSLVDRTRVLVIVVFEDGRIQSLAGAMGSPRNFEFSDDGRYFLESAQEGVRIWDVETAELALALNEPIARAAFTGDEPRVLLADSADVVEMQLTGEVEFHWSLDGRRRSGNAFVTGGETVVGFTATEDVVAKTRTKTLGVWFAAPRTSDVAVALTDDALVRLETAPDSGKRLVRFTRDHAGATHTFSLPESQSDWDGQVLLSPDETRVAAIFPDSVRILDTTTLSLLATLPAGAGMVAWSPSGKYLVTTPDVHYREPQRPAYDLKKTVTLWDSSSGRVAARFHTPVVARGIAFSEDGKVLLGWGQEFAVRIDERKLTSGEKVSFTMFDPTGEPSTFRIEVETGSVTTDAMPPRPPFVGSARELVATKEGIFRVSTGQQVSLFPVPASEDAIFSGDSSLVLADSLSSVADGHLVAPSPFGFARALSKDGRRIVIDDDVYCLLAR